jgi:hypothetical protein
VRKVVVGVSGVEIMGLQCKMCIGTRAIKHGAVFLQSDFLGFLLGSHFYLLFSRFFIFLWHWLMSHTYKRSFISCQSHFIFKKGPFPSLWRSFGLNFKPFTPLCVVTFLLRSIYCTILLLSMFINTWFTKAKKKLKKKTVIKEGQTT